MELFVKTLSFCILVMQLNTVYASEDVCNMSNIDICKRNVMYANEVVETLPVKVNRNLTISSIYTKYQCDSI